MGKGGVGGKSWCGDAKIMRSFQSCWKKPDCNMLQALAFKDVKASSAEISDCSSVTSNMRLATSFDVAAAQQGPI